MSEDSLRLQIFCRNTVEHCGESYNIVAYLDAYHPSEVFVRTLDDNDYPDDRYPITSVDKITAMKFREQRGEYPWEVMMREAEQALREPAHG